jgi:D-tyrosyl-tRNA(Tyr) deacylase
LRCVIQRAARAEVRVDGEVTGRIGGGLVVLAAFAGGDGEAELAWMAAKLPDLRLFNDAAGKINRSLRDVGGAILLVSQFTLYGDCRKGNRPSFVGSAPPAQAAAQYARFAALLRAQAVPVEEGRFGAMMEVELVDAGPVTLVVDRDAARPAAARPPEEGA